MNPNIQRTVEWLNKHGFETCDSGDGESHDFECDREYAYVVLVVNPNLMVSESKRLVRLLEQEGLAVDVVNADGNPCMQVNYDPIDDMSFIDLWNITDTVLFPPN